MHPIFGLATATLAALGVAYAVPVPTASAVPEYQADQMNEFAATGERMINDYFDRIGITGHARPTVMYIVAGGAAASGCVDVARNATQRDRSLNYCGTDNTIYVGQDIVWDSYRQFGSTATLSGLAHEYGHFLQAISGVPRPTSPGETIRSEDQADCVSGAFMGFLRDRGDIEESADVDSVERYLTSTASADLPGRDHGTAGERISSFMLGYSGALPACNQFYPATPITR